jgi:aminopeptidase N
MIDEPTDYRIEGYAARELPGYLQNLPQMASASPSRLIDKTLAETQASMRIFTDWFGPAPYGRIAITQQPEFSFGQSWPGLVYLPMSAFLDSTQRWQLMGSINRGLTEFIQEVTAHEVAHQWWGHMVTWASFHDQWLSEGFADFSAGLFLQLTEKDPQKYWKYLESSRDTILEKNNFGRRANDAGPLWMGLRLSTQKNAGAYQRLVYPKGGYVLHMLRMLMWDAKTGDQAFKEMMREFVRTHLHKRATTESFLAVVNRHMKPSMDLTGRKTMDWFFAQWVFGTEVPRYKFDYTITPKDNQFLLKASITQSEVSQNFAMPVPIYLDFDGRLARLGQVVMIGSSTNDKIEVMLPKKPRRVLLNANYDVLAHK